MVYIGVPPSRGRRIPFLPADSSPKGHISALLGSHRQAEQGKGAARVLGVNAIFFLYCQRGSCGRLRTWCTSTKNSASQKSLGLSLQLQY